MPTFPTASFYSTADNPTNEFGFNLRDKIVDAACTIWKNYPAWVTQNKNLPGSLIRGHMNSICNTGVGIPPSPQAPFTGGQCTNLRYHVEGFYEEANTGAAFNCRDERPFNTQSLTPQGVFGRIISVGIIPFGSGTALGLTRQNADNSLAYSRVGNPGVGQTIGIREVCANYKGNDSPGLSYQGNAYITNVTVVGGDPDVCGDPDIEYPDVTPSFNDLHTTIVINNNDGVDTTFNLDFNQVVIGQNFPMGFKLNGINVTLDLSGLTIHGNPNITSPSNNDAPPPPGSDGGQDGIGNQNDTTFPDTIYPELPEFVTPETVLESFERALCTEGVLEITTLTIQTIIGSNPVSVILAQMLINILQELCGMEGGDALVGIPEYNILRPGAERPAIVYLWKEVINNTIQRSTYSSTVQNPSASAVANINTITVPDKTIGTYMTTVGLIDGSRIKASGDTQANADTNFFFLLDQVDSSFKQPNINDRITRSQNTRLEVKTLKCRQIEYYPNGKSANTSPIVRRVIDIT